MSLRHRQPPFRANSSVGAVGATATTAIAAIAAARAAATRTANASLCYRRASASASGAAAPSPSSSRAPAAGPGRKGSAALTRPSYRERRARPVVRWARPRGPCESTGVVVAALPSPFPVVRYLRTVWPTAPPPARPWPRRRPRFQGRRTLPAHRWARSWPRRRRLLSVLIFNREWARRTGAGLLSALIFNRKWARRTGAGLLSALYFNREWARRAGAGLLSVLYFNREWARGPIALVCSLNLSFNSKRVWVPLYLFFNSATGFGFVRAGLHIVSCDD